MQLLESITSSHTTQSIRTCGWLDQARESAGQHPNIQNNLPQLPSHTAGDALGAVTCRQTPQEDNKMHVNTNRKRARCITPQCAVGGFLRSVESGASSSVLLVETANFDALLTDIPHPNATPNSSQGPQRGLVNDRHPTAAMEITLKAQCTGYSCSHCILTGVFNVPFVASWRRSSLLPRLCWHHGGM